MDRLKAADLVQILRWRADHQPDKILAIHLNDDGSELERLTAVELDRRARAAAGLMLSVAEPGDHAVLAYPAGPDFLTAFLGALYAGVVAVPVHVPGPRRSFGPLAAIAADADARLVLTRGDMAERLTGSFGAASERPPLVLATDGSVCPDRVLPPAGVVVPDPGGLAYLQYTSGSTGAPRGVMITHANIMANVRNLISAFGSKPSAMVSWLPHFHDMGLTLGLLQGLAAGFPSVLMAPASFTQQPARWLKALSRYRASHTVAPNFAFDLCVRSIRPEQRDGLDLSALECVVNGAEPVRWPTLTAFAGAFAPNGFRLSAFSPGYGLAEATLVVSGVRTGGMPRRMLLDRDALAHSEVRTAAPACAAVSDIVSCGPLVAGLRVAIVDPESGERLPSGRVGEIWVAGESVAAGYWRKPVLTEALFGARLPDDPGPWLRTGDLGFLDGGELFIAGRTKDLLIVRGRNHYPQDIERTVTAYHPALAQGVAAAFMVEAEGEEHLVVAVEPGRAALRTLDAAAVMTAVRAAVADDHDLTARVVVLVRPNGMPLTTSGKIQRRVARQAFLDGALVELARSGALPDGRAPVNGREDGQANSDGAALVEWLVGRLAARLGIPADTIDPQAPFATAGLDSVGATALAGELEIWLGRPLPPALLYEHPSPTALARYLTGGPSIPGPRRTVAAAGSTAEPVAEPVAVVGIGCRFPGADGPEAFWRLLTDGVEAVGPVPAGRWNAEALHDATGARPGTVRNRRGGFLDGIDGFDAEFFGMSPAEADRLDPQQRLLLEVSWEALEHAGIAPDRLAGTATGVFVGLASADYLIRQLQRNDPRLAGPYLATGGSAAAAAGRLSYLLDLRGPSLAVDTACSASLVAVHLACRSLASGECDAALAGGANILLCPELSIDLSHMQVIGAAGSCRAFDAEADGYVRSEGGGVVVLKRLSDARKAGDRVLAVIRGTAVNHGGRANGLTAPNGTAQELLIGEALATAGVAPAEVGVVEAHGTGTSLGDSVELRALARAFGRDRPQDRPLLVGSVKTNLGHMEAAAGIAGLIKMVLALRHGRVPAHLHVRTPNSALYDGGGLALPHGTVDWPDGNGRRIAGVSSFGFSGTNAHAVLEAAPADDVPTPPACRGDGRAALLVCSAASAAGLDARRRDLAAWLRVDGNRVATADLCHTTSVRRTHYRHRLAVVGHGAEELAAALERAVPVTPKVGGAPRVAFVFAGVGSQSTEAARALLGEPAFAAALRRAATVLDPLVARPILDELAVSEGGAPSMPLQFALQTAMAAQWRAWGIEPAAVAGHSLGEVAAAHLSGALDLAQAARVVVARARLIDGVANRGYGMASVALSPEEMRELLDRSGEPVVIAAVNGARSVTLAGPDGALDRLFAVFAERGVPRRRLDVTTAMHSPQCDPLCGPLAEALAGLTPCAPSIPIVSTVSGEPAGAGAFGADHWAMHLRAPVRFAQALDRLCALGCTALLEVGTHSSLTHPLAEAAERNGLSPLLPGGDKGSPPHAAVLATLGRLYEAGAAVDWLAVHPAGRLVDLPRYPWQRRRHWFAEARPARPLPVQPMPTSAGSALPLRRIEIAGPDRARRWPALVELDTAGLAADHWLFGHVFQGTPLMPVSGLLDLGWTAAGAKVLSDVAFLRMLPLAGGAAVVQCQAAPDGSVAFYARDSADDWTLYATARRGEDGRTAAAPAPVPAGEARRMEAGAFAERLAALGLVCAALGVLDEVVDCGGGGLEVRLKAGASVPAALEAGLQVMACTGMREGEDLLFVPTRIAHVERSADGGSPDRVQLLVRRDAGGAFLHGELRVCDGGGRPLLVLLGIEAQGRAVGPAVPAAEPGGRMAASGTGALRARLAGLPPGRRRQLLVAHLCEAVARLLGYGADQVDPERGFFDLGMDSVTALRLKLELETALGCPLPVTLAFDAPTVARLAARLDGLLFPGEEPPPPPPAPPPGAGVGEGELLAQIDRELEALTALIGAGGQDHGR